MKKLDEFFDLQINTGLSNKTQSNKIYPLLKKLEENNLLKVMKEPIIRRKLNFIKLLKMG
ncbi:MAG: hypothetical protein IJJ47_02585 [Methanosphaera sp.]|nr:hypothetical protein [Methanosphaera sp.]